MAENAKKLTYNDYTVGIICPLEVEMTAMRYMLDEEHARLPRKDNDRNRYILGKMGNHNIAIGYLLQGSQGIGAAATVATDMRRSFPSIQLRLLVGIGGGIPSKQNDIRLGDVVVGMPDGTHGGVVQYDLGKRTVNGFERKGSLHPPPDEWRTAVVEMKSDHEAKPSRIDEFLSEMLKTYPKLQKYARPKQELDVLYHPESIHIQDEPTCDKCDKSKIIPPRSAVDTKIFYGTIASGDSVIKNALERDKLSKAAGGALCFEMEAAGLGNGFPCLVIRGICDYADSHKNDDWHFYAAAVAAACAKELLTYMDPVPVQEVKLTTYFSVPRQRVKIFFGREKELDQIASFFSYNFDRPRILVLRAMGGQGKSQIALEHCQRTRDIYRGVFWVNSSSTSTTIQSLVSIAQQLDPSAVAVLSNDDAQVAFTRRTLEQWNERWLMVFDNCDNSDVFSTVNEFITDGGKGDFLVTSRHRGMEELGSTIEIPCMPEKAGVELLLHRYQDINVEDHLEEGFKIVDRLGGLALAIDQASAFIAYKQLPIEKLNSFLEQYEAQRKKILQHTAESFWKYTQINDEKGREIARSAFTTWEMSFQQLLRNCEMPESVEHFLTVTAFLGPTYVSENMFELHWKLCKPPPLWFDIFLTSPCSDSDTECSIREGDKDVNEKEQEKSDSVYATTSTEKSKLTEDWDVDRFWHLIRQLYQMSLVQSLSTATKSEGSAFLLHPLIRDWLQLRQRSKTRQTYTYEVVELIVSCIRCFESFILGAGAKKLLLLHMDAVLLEMKELTKEGYRFGQDIMTCDNAEWFAQFYHKQGQYDGSLDLLRTVVKTRTQTQGKEHPSTLKAMNNLASILHEQGKYREAEQMKREVLNLREKVLGVEHPFTIHSMSNLATTMFEQGKYELAELMCRKVLELTEKLLGLEHRDTLSSMGNLAEVLRVRGDYESSEAIGGQTVQLSTKLLGRVHPDTLLHMSNLALAQFRQGKTEVAKQTLQQVLELRQKILGEEHPDTLLCMSNLASIFDEQGEHGKAVEMHHTVFERREQLLGKNHPDTLESMNNLALALDRQGKIKQAEQMYQQTLKLRQTILGEKHPETLRSMNNLAATLRHQKRLKEAEEMYQHTLELSRKVLGVENPFTLTCMSNLASVLNDQGNDEQSVEMMRLVLKHTKNRWGQDHPETMTTRNNLALALDTQGKYREAEEMHRYNLELCEKLERKTHPQTMSCMHSLGSVLMHQKKFEEAEEMYQRAMEGRQTILGKEHPATLLSMSCLAEALRHQNKYAQSEEMYRQVLKLEKKVLGHEHQNTLADMHNLALALMNQRKFDAADQMFRDLLPLQQRVLGKTHVLQLKSLKYFAQVQLAKGKLQEADAAYREILLAQKEKLGEEHPDSITTMLDLAGVMTQRSKVVEAEEAYRELEKISAKVLGKEHVQSLASTHNLGLVLMYQGKFQEAGETFQANLALREKVLGKEHIAYARTLYFLAETYANQGRLQESAKLLEQDVEIFVRTLGSEHIETLTSMHALAWTCDNLGRLEEAERLYTKVLETRTRVCGAAHSDTLSSMKHLATTLKKKGELVKAAELMEQYNNLRPQVSANNQPQKQGSAAELPESKIEELKLGALTSGQDDEKGVDLDAIQSGKPATLEEEQAEKKQKQEQNDSDADNTPVVSTSEP